MAIGLINGLYCVRHLPLVCEIEHCSLGQGQCVSEGAVSSECVGVGTGYICTPPHPPFTRSLLTLSPLVVQSAVNHRNKESWLSYMLLLVVARLCWLNVSRKLACPLTHLLTYSLTHSLTLSLLIQTHSPVVISPLLLEFCWLKFP